ncbi:MAG TPA: hypothetical protein P5556_03105 [Candidatus Gastranaerophilales bacterium]|nr:hypothetical protein [Candidatus Gastranaerophilales bacterium]
MSNLADIKEKKMPITINNKTKYLHYDLNAFAELEEIYGSIDKALNELSEGRVKAIINFLWAGLIHEDETLSIKDVGKMFDLSQIQEIGSLINKAIILAIPEQKDSTAKKKT